MDGCPRRGDPSFPGWIITLWLKFAFNCTALSVIPCCVDKSPAGSPAHSLHCRCPQTKSIVPAIHPFCSILTPAAYPVLVGWWRCVRRPLGITAGPKALPTGSLRDGHNCWILICCDLYALCLPGEGGQAAAGMVGGGTGNRAVSRQSMGATLHASPETQRKHKPRWKGFTLNLWVGGGRSEISDKPIGGLWGTTGSGAGDLSTSGLLGACLSFPQTSGQGNTSPASKTLGTSPGAEMPHGGQSWKFSVGSPAFPWSLPKANKEWKT